MHTSINKLELFLSPYQFNPCTDGRTADCYNRFVAYKRNHVSSFLIVVNFSVSIEHFDIFRIKSEQKFLN